MDLQRQRHPAPEAAEPRRSRSAPGRPRAPSRSTSTTSTSASPSAGFEYGPAFRGSRPPGARRGDLRRGLAAGAAADEAGRFGCTRRCCEAALQLGSRCESGRGASGEAAAALLPGRSVRCAGARPCGLRVAPHRRRGRHLVGLPTAARWLDRRRRCAPVRSSARSAAARRAAAGSSWVAATRASAPERTGARRSRVAVRCEIAGLARPARPRERRRRDRAWPSSRADVAADRPIPAAPPAQRRSGAGAAPGLARRRARSGTPPVLCSPRARSPPATARPRPRHRAALGAGALGPVRAPRPLRPGRQRRLGGLARQPGGASSRRGEEPQLALREGRALAPRLAAAALRRRRGRRRRSTPSARS